MTGSISRRSGRACRCLLLAAFVASGALPTASASTTLTLTNEFIEEYADRATIEGTLLIDYAHDKPKRPKQDGDIHIAGWSPTRLMDRLIRSSIVTWDPVAEG